MAEVTITIKTENADEAVRAVRAVEKALKQMGVEAKVVAGELGKQEDALEGSSKQADKATAADKDLADASIDVAGAIAKHWAAHRTLELVLKTVKEGTAATAAGIRTGLTVALAAATKTVKELARQAKTFAIGILPLLGAAAAAVAAVVGVKLFNALDRTLTRMGLAGARIATLSKGFDNLSTSIGSTGDRMLRILRQGTLNTIDNFRLLKAGSFALSTELVTTEAQMAELARLGTALGIAVGEDAAFGIEKLTRGTVLHNIATLKALGIVVSTSAAYEKEAERLGTVASKLTEVQRRTAFTNEVFEKANRVVARQALELDNVATSAAKTTTAIINLRQAFNQAAAESEKLTEFAARQAELTTNLGAAAEELAFIFTLLTNATNSFKLQLLALIEDTPPGTILQLAEAFGALQLAIEAATEARVEAIGAGTFGPFEFPEGFVPPPTSGARLFELGLEGGQAPEVAVRDLNVAIVDLSDMVRETANPALQAMGERIADIADGTITLADITEEVGERIGNALVPAMVAIGGSVSLSRAEITALAQSLQGLSLDEITEAMKAQGIAGMDLAAVLAALGEQTEGLGDITREQAAAMTAAATALKTAMVGAFVEMGQAIGEILAGAEDAMENFGQKITRLLGTLLSTVGRILIAFGVAGLAIKAFAINPFAAIAAGIALTALGAALASSATAAVSNFGGGGGGFASIAPPPQFLDGQRQITIQIVARDLDRAGAERIIEELNITDQLDRPIQLETTLFRI